METICPLVVEQLGFHPCRFSSITPSNSFDSAYDRLPDKAHAHRLPGNNLADHVAASKAQEPEAAAAPKDTKHYGRSTDIEQRLFQFCNWPIAKRHVNDDQQNPEQTDAPGDA